LSVATFRELLTASDAELLKHFYRVEPSADGDFIRRINHAATQLELTHTQLVCALGFNRSMRDLTDILSVVGFSSHKLLCYRRNELFATDAYRQLPIDNVLDVYAALLEDAEVLATLRELVPARLDHIEARMGESEDAALLISYKMELHSIYAGGIATAAFALARLARPIGDLRVKIDEVSLVVGHGLVPASNLFFSDDLLPAEKRSLIESGAIDAAMIANRLKNSEISEDERQMLEDFA
jgi:hypothetical protein